MDRIRLIPSRTTLRAALGAVFGCCFLASCAPVSHRVDDAPTITRSRFGTLTNGESVDEFTLSNGNGVTTSILTWGGIIRTLWAPGKDGKSADIVLGYDSLAPYEARHPYFGTITGRVANRIARGKFSIDGKDYSLATNNGPNHLHGGINGFDRKNWAARTESGPDSVSLILTHTSPDGDEGYPGEVSVEVRYTLDTSGALRADYRATTTKATPINLTNHSYFNLAGHSSGSALRQHLEIVADSYVPVDETLIPTGQLLRVAETPFDFSRAHAINDKIKDVGIGYDHSFVINPGPERLRRAAVAWDPESGRTLEVLTTQPGVQLYTGNHLSAKEIGKGGAVYDKHSAFCLETQHLPDSVNQPRFPRVIVRPGEEYSHTTIYRLSVR